MAMVKLNDNITELEGSEGGTVFRKDVCGQHAQAKPRTTKSRSPSQIRQQKSFLKALRFCNERRMTWDEWVSWWVYSINHPVVNKKGEKTILPPCQSCMKINITRARNSVPMTSTAPN